jgi:hypothetical protein
MSQTVDKSSTLSGSTTFTIDREYVMFETLDDETVVIDLGTGTYYSISGCGVELWAALVDGSSLGAIVELMQQRFPDIADLQGTVHDWVNQVCKEGLVQVAVVGGPLSVEVSQMAEIPEMPENPEVAHVGTTEKLTVPPDGADLFKPPVLSRYTDMQSLLLLDPVHEVDAGAGWPNVPLVQP